MKKPHFLAVAALLCSCGGGEGLGSGSSIPDSKPVSESQMSSSSHLLGDSTAVSTESSSVMSLEEENENMRVTINGTLFELELADNEAVRVFERLLPLDLNMSSMAHEKYCYLDTSLPTDVYSPGRIEAGDVMLWGSDCLVFFYESFNTSYSYTRLGRLTSTDGLLEACSSPSTHITIEK